jgi:DNA-binding transcriptional ArsR family regulator
VQSPDGNNLRAWYVLASKGEGMKRRYPLDDESVDRRVEVLKALANPTRLTLVMFLSRGAATVSTLAESLALKPCIASQQLGILRLSDIVRGRREGGCVRYELIDPRVSRLIRDLNTKKTPDVKRGLDTSKVR